MIHAVGPVWHGGHAGEPKALASCYRAILREADDVGARSVAIPAISTGIYGYPLEGACQIAVDTLRNGLPESQVGSVQLSWPSTTAHPPRWRPRWAPTERPDQ